MTERSFGNRLVRLLAISPLIAVNALLLLAITLCERISLVLAKVYDPLADWTLSWIHGDNQ